MSERTRNRGFVASATLLVILILVSFLAGDDDHKKDKPGTEPTTESSPPVEGDCVQVKMDPNTGNKVISTGLTTPDTEKIRKQVLELNKHDPNALFLYYNASPLGTTSPLTSVQELVEGEVKDGSCFSVKGLAAFNEWAVLWKVAILTPVDAMPPGWTNTGVGENGPTSGAPPTGDTSGVIVGFPNSNVKHGVMNRCGNPVVATPPPNVPKGPTDEPPPTTPTTEKPPLSYECQQNGVNCPPGVVNDVVQPPQDNNTSGVDTGPTPGAPADPPPPAVRPPGDPDGESGDGGAPAPTGPTDDSDADEVTEPPPPGVDPCPLGPGMC